ncbi:hypothetical protein MPL3365_180162 [Mesorhizobium plurifarium]|uniref:Uncharacterized protein n=1 Tax=Mesorhizobium plurifarium TaxID=69974 RepID=A0A090G6N4_MESPL|nr:hypothetical protein MPL3365_180162 [Mesorhizobium plurifarium]
MRHLGCGPFDHRPPAGDEAHRFIARAGRPVRYCRGQRPRVEEVHPDAAGAQQYIRQPGQFLIGDHPETRAEVVRLPELRDARALPIPPLNGTRRLIRRIGLKDRHVMTVAAKHGRRAQPDYASTANQDLAHPVPQCPRGSALY